ncbi:hypothetical protein TcasGA2_TC008639 [Tribolium castaneum]|uniref:Dynein attachment factor N-terminal domain-containing protein n=1 Tax=Tribolium castaneum TaxID=7070 RepID=D6WT85_TRICA|nr:PREDICTED: coiled-coil domain-containing protein 103 [Tribolium castaneum]XP_015837622.1 PREDICTED: coiled-coil domain-containing protein 103 [Tribolium castaneum]EFA05848.2 hypothetical protein TcasGA2_TC008639 [Tribolium castaneum]|eukprot:XP_008196398.1 PREDICTED: coiled-coil domain-containing protein 103 [Tribolium castaneum]
MSSHQISNKKLYEELKSAIDEDKMYWLKNDAKLRAVNSSKSYDEFRDIVAAAHLQPVTKKDKERNQRSWKTLTDSD